MKEAHVQMQGLLRGDSPLAAVCPVRLQHRKRLAGLAQHWKQSDEVLVLWVLQV